MADIGPRHANPLPENTFPAAGVRRDDNILPPPRRPQTPPSPQRRPVPVQPHVHTFEPQNAPLVRKWHRDITYLLTLICMRFQFLPANVGGNHHHGHWEDMHPLIRNVAVQGQPQDLRYNDIEYYAIGHYPIPHPEVNFYPWVINLRS